MSRFIIPSNYGNFEFHARFIFRLRTVFSLDKALFQVEKMLKEGATIIDIGGESTRSMAEEVPETEELQRVIPLVEAVQKRFDCWISVDTSKAIVMQEAAKVGHGFNQ